MFFVLHCFGAFSFFVQGPGLAIRVICAREPYMCSDFDSTQALVQALLGRPCSNPEAAAVAEAALKQADRDGVCLCVLVCV